jgi:hypothetical protein
MWLRSALRTGAVLRADDLVFSLSSRYIGVMQRRIASFPTTSTPGFRGTFGLRVTR